ncbi:MAG: acetyltransferase [Synergistaceae bacterium]|nr:acetyltransferase [Synergistaceae bacterium]
MTKPKDIVIIGSSSLAKETVWIIDTVNRRGREWNFIGFVDDKKPDDAAVLGGDEWLLSRKEEIYAVCAIGDNATRKSVVDKISRNPSVKFANIISPQAIISPRVLMGAGNIIFPNSLVTVDVTIGSHVVINGNCNVSHDCVIGDFCCLSPGATLCGNVTLGGGVFIGAGAVVIQGLAVGENALIGAGAVVIGNADAESLYVGIPARTAGHAR